MDLPPDLIEVLDYAHQERRGMMVTRHSAVCFTIVVLDDDGKLYQWRAHLSVDCRWTLSPIVLEWDNAERYF